MWLRVDRPGRRWDYWYSKKIEENDVLDKRKALYNQAVKKLEPRELEILTARRLDEETKTLEDLSQKYSISRERVRQIENKAIKKLQEEIKLISENNLLTKEWFILKLSDFFQVLKKQF